MVKARWNYAVLAPILLSICTVSHADSWVCDLHGRRISADHPPEECKDVEIRHLNPDGSLKEVIPSPKEQRLLDAEEAARRAQAALDRAQKQQDRALLQKYENSEQIDEACTRATATRRALTDRADKLIAQYERERKHLDDEAEFYLGKTMPDDLKRKFEVNRALTEQQRKAKSDVLQEIQAINAYFAQEKHRYLELRPE